MNRRMLGLCCAVLLPWAARGGEIGYIEQFSLADDRAEPLKQLIPGTEDYYYYHCLHYQNSGQLDKVPELLDQWIKRYQYTPRVEEIRNRQALLTYRQNPQATLDYIKREEGLVFNHAREQAAQKNQYPAKLDPQLVSRDTLAKNAFNRPALSGFTDAALEWLAGQSLTPEQHRHLLQRLAEPDVAGLSDMILADL